MDTRHPRHGWWPVLSAAIAILCLTFGVAAGAPTSEAPEIADGDIVAAIELEMLTDGAVPAHAISVSCENGIVTLNGTVDNLLARERALRIARTTRGARGIVNRLDVTPVRRGDSELRADVLRSLREDPATDSWEIQPLVKDGNVTLMGTVDSWAERTLAEKVTMGVRGVRDIQNDIAVVHEDERADAEIKAEIERRMQMDVWVRDGLVNVEVSDGRVRLSGNVGSVFEKTRAVNDAWLPGVKDVDDSELAVSDWLRDRMRRERLATPSDDAIADAIREAHRLDPRVSAFTPGVAVTNGSVTLTGFVSNLAAKTAAEEDARNVLGVRRVHNFIKVNPPQPLSDARLESKVERALKRDPYVHPFDIHVRARNGLVTLTGDVHSDFEKERSEVVASRVKGVQAVRNLLEPPSVYDPLVYRSLRRPLPPTILTKTDAEIEDDIRQQLFWSPFVESDEVQVTVANGVATLSGTVDSWSERKAARDNAYDGGATAVIDRIEVRLEGS